MPPIDETSAPSQFSDPTGEIPEGFDTDAALSAIEAGGTYEQPAPAPTGGTPDHSTTKPPGAQAEPGAAQAPSPAESAAPAQQFKINVRGQEITVAANDPRLSQWLAQGYTVAQDRASFNQERQAWQAEKQRYESQYGPIDKFVRENPDFWDHVTQSWQQRQQMGALHGVDPSNPLAQELIALRESIRPVQDFVKQTQEQQIAQQRAQEDSALDQEIQSIRDKFKDLDWATPDEKGRTLELRVLEHAQAIGAKSFDLAFKHLLHDELVKRSAEQAKQAALADFQKQKKAGIVGVSPSPSKGTQGGERVKHRNMEDAYQAALEEIGLGRGA